MEPTPQSTLPAPMFASFRVPDVAVVEDAKKDKPPSPRPNVREHTLIACNSCRQRKLKCSGEDCCSRCKSDGRPCIYARSRRGNGATRARKQSRASSPSSLTNRGEKSMAANPNGSSMSTPSASGSDNFHDNFHDNIRDERAEIAATEPSSSAASDGQNPFNIETMSFLANLDMYDFTTSTDTPDAGMSSESHVPARSGVTDLSSVVSTEVLGHLNSATKHSTAINFSHAPTSCCLGSILDHLESIGVHRASAQATGVDGFLIYLRSSTKACTAMLDCAECQLYLEKPMLMAAVVHQMGNVCSDLAKLLSQRESGGGGDDVIGTSGGPIWVGQYIVEAPEVRENIIYHLVELHVHDLLALLRNVLEKLDRQNEAYKLIMEAKERAYNTLLSLQPKKDALRDDYSRRLYLC
ncbi:fungal-specific transcription factor domain protein [Apiospora kogelbergensis]|uniref:Fungal-specific transcription factor domain protein n=1 Tax=Apiospora kogelbergensis TaxID=1337665 RepID=A0AAW0R5N7_9PEZI